MKAPDEMPIKQLFEKISTKHNPPSKGWYDTDKGNLYWYEQKNAFSAWSCRDEYLSEEYPKFWYLQSIEQPAEKERQSSSFSVIDNENKLHIIRKYIKAGDGEESVWCDDWYGRHVIGNGCKFYSQSSPAMSPKPQEEITGLKDEIKFGKVNFKFGDKVLNHYAAKTNPHKIGIVYSCTSYLVKCTDMHGGYWEFNNGKDLRLEKIGSLFESENMEIAVLRSQFDKEMGAQPTRMNDYRWQGVIWYLKRIGSQMTANRRELLIDFYCRNDKYNTGKTRNVDLPKYYAECRKQAGIFVDDYLTSLNQKEK